MSPIGSDSRLDFTAPQVPGALNLGRVNHIDVGGLGRVQINHGTQAHRFALNPGIHFQVYGAIDSEANIRGYGSRSVSAHQYDRARSEFLSERRSKVWGTNQHV